MINRNEVFRSVAAAGLWLGFLAATSVAFADAPATRKATVPVVTVVDVRRGDVIETVQVTGTLTAREEILVGTEIEGLRILELLADEGDMVRKGQVLARLSSETLIAQLAQSTAQLVRADATIEQARSSIALAEASIAQSEPALTRARALLRTGSGTDVVVEQRVSEQNSNLARLNSARRGLAVSQADKLNLEAQRDELNLRLARTEVKAPAAGLVSRRSARVGGVASMAAESMFKIIADGDVELEAEVPDFRLQKVRAGQTAIILPAGDHRLKGAVRLVSPEVDKASRMGKVRISIAPDATLKIGAFARGEIETQRRNSIAAPASSILYDAEGAYAQTVRDGKVATNRVKIGLVAAGMAEVTSGLAEGEVLILRAGAFLHDGDFVEVKISEPSKDQTLREQLGSR